MLDTYTFDEWQDCLKAIFYEKRRGKSEEISFNPAESMVE